MAEMSEGTVLHRFGSQEVDDGTVFVSRSRTQRDLRLLSAQQPGQRGVIHYQLISKRVPPVRVPLEHLQFLATSDFCTVQPVMDPHDVAVGIVQEIVDATLARAAA